MTDTAPIIFIVDDDDAVRKALARGVTLRGYRAASYSSAAGFLEEYIPGTPGCILLDQGMPKMTGLELQELLVNRGDTIPIIFMTGHGGARHSEQALKRGAVGFLEKPFKQSDLFELITSTLLEDDSS